ncbi:unnamed protein product [Gulo gulo]|uniref:Uncharacterized protein n=1 Tax=Gulo gulo TaxID=48420 RepID=A0A9X9PZX3_GULGU|nr:unnamed protein product [Gulo gulo]
MCTTALAPPTDAALAYTHGGLASPARVHSCPGPGRACQAGPAVDLTGACAL